MSSHEMRVVCRIGSAGISLMVLSGGKTMYRDYQMFPAGGADDRHVYDRMTHQAGVMLYRMVVAAHAAIRVPASSCVIVVGEPWSHMISRRIEHARKTPFKLSRTLVRDLVARDMKRAEVDYQEHRHSAHTEFSSPRYHNLAIAGHRVQEPWNRMVNDIRVDYTTGWFDTAIVDMARSLVHEHMRVRLLNITVQHAQACIAAWWDEYGTKNALLINPTGRVTELSIFQNGILSQWGTVPMGVPTFEQSVLDDLQIRTTELPGLISLYRDKLLDEKNLTKIDRALGKTFAAWRRDVDEFSRSAMERGMVVEQIVWVGDAHHPVLQYLMRSVSLDSLSFPAVFGSSQVGSIMIGTLIPDIRNEPGLAEDHIVLYGISS